MLATNILRIIIIHCFATTADPINLVSPVDIIAQPRMALVPLKRYNKRSHARSFTLLAKMDNNNNKPSTTTTASATTTAAATTSTFPRTFYRRQLPSTAISFSSPEGRAVFATAMANGGTYTFFPLIEQL